MTYDPEPKLSEFWAEVLRVWKTYDVSLIKSGRSLEPFAKLADSKIINKRNYEKELLVSNIIDQVKVVRTPEQHESVESRIYSAINKEYTHNGAWPSISRIAAVLDLSEVYVHQVIGKMASKKKVIKYYNANEGFLRVRIEFLKDDV